MKAVAYSIKPFEKEYLAKANQKKHDITLISNPLGPDTAIYAEGKDAVIVFTNDDVSAVVIGKLAALGVKYIVTRSSGTDHINKDAAAAHHIKIANVPSYSPQAIAEHAVAMAFALNRQVVKADQHSHAFDFRNDGLIGFNFAGKTVGIVGLGSTGRAAAAIYHGLGCDVIGYDLFFPADEPYTKPVSLEYLLENADIITLHVPLTADTRHFINTESIAKMKNGVMLINTSRGLLVNTADALSAIKSGKIGYLGIDVYEFEKGLFFEDHQKDAIKDPLLNKLMEHPNVLVTPHQAYLTREALQEIANSTIKSLDLWQQNKCVGKACACAKECQKTVPNNILTEVNNGK
ncbi:2-hydroxyacid dehydrogenase [Mucilaginibacter ginsenosidivorax]|uniref:2-hydroxyacid dehydrogenase n=1 Tax=Mucilaginibacter ginsenosidivorax TaxID=862126 RepID=A0A5B8W771_9SPHI|nr:2-hydroxyacid dehydrogenase [Mucilaginibacter ginsenosidivorax]QEC79551.1 2-hydroxyacid dehydrogenase [Mucilaginibacter ginsenosidivorax]